MQYVRNLSDSVSTAWNSINPATLSGAIDVIVVEQEDGTLLCSPFHVRFGKFSLLRPYEKKVEFKLNGVKQNYSMKLGEGGEAFFVFETSDNIPQSLRTSPISSPASSPEMQPQAASATDLREVDPLDLDSDVTKTRSAGNLVRPPPAIVYSTSMPPDNGYLTPLSTSPELSHGRPKSGDWSALSHRVHSDDILRKSARRLSSSHELRDGSEDDDKSRAASDRSHSPPPLAPREAIERAMTLSRELSAVNIPTQVTETGDLMLDMSGFKNNEEEALRAEVVARRVLSEELQGNYDVGALFGMDEQGNLWIYSSEAAKEAAMKRVMGASLRPSPVLAIDAASDPGYHSDDSAATTPLPSHRRSESDVGQMVLQTPPSSPGSTGSAAPAGDPNLNYAKTLRLTSDQLKALNLKPGENAMSFTVNRATCSAYMYLWRHETPVVISDIDGTITKSDALGQMLNMIGRDWTHAGVAKLYSDIVTNGYNIMYLTSRSVGQADTTRAYLAGVSQEGYRLPRGPTILSPDRTMAALRREIYLRKPHVFKMATLRDIRGLYGADHHPFYAGFGNRLTDQISYRTVGVTSSRIFTINSNAEVSLDLLSLNRLKLSYVNITEVVDHYFPPVSTLVKGGGEDFTDFKYWRDTPLDLDEFSASDSNEDEEGAAMDHESQYAEEEEDEEIGDGMGDSYISRNSVDDYGEGSVLSGDYEEEDHMMSSILEDEYADDENEGDNDDDDDDHDHDHEMGNGTREDDTQVVKPVDPLKLKSPQVAVEDVDAELMTGVEKLSLAKEAK